MLLPKSQDCICFAFSYERIFSTQAQNFDKKCYFSLWIWFPIHRAGTRSQDDFLQNARIWTEILQFPGKIRTVTMKIACVLTCSCKSRSCFFAAISKMNSVLKASVAKLIKINKCKCNSTRKFACSLGYFHRHLKSDDTECYSPFELHSSWLFFYDLMYNFNFSSCEQT